MRTQADFMHKRSEVSAALPNRMQPRHQNAIKRLIEEHTGAKKIYKMGEIKCMNNECTLQAVKISNLKRVVTTFYSL